MCWTAQNIEHVEIDLCISVNATY